MKTIIVVLLAIIPSMTYAQNEKGELKGVITYFFNNNFGDKPDVGAQVIVQKINPLEHSPEEIKYDTALANLKQQISLLEQTINKQNKDIADLDTTGKKPVAIKGKSIPAIKTKPVQITKKKSLQAAIDSEQIQHDQYVNANKDFLNASNKSFLKYSEYYDKMQSEADRHYHKQNNIIDTLSKFSGENENKIKWRKLNCERELNIANKTNAEERYKSTLDMLKYEEEMDGYKLMTKKQTETMEIMRIIANLKMAEMERGYLKVAPTNKFKNEQIEKLKNLNAYPEEKFDAIDNTVYKMVSDIENGRNVKITTVDGNGNYSIKLDPGMYYLIIRSKGRKEHSLTESRGRISGIDVVEIKANEVVEKSENFTGGY